MNKIVSKISSKAQTVIPRDVRERLGLKTGDRLRYRYTQTGVMIEKDEEEPEEDPFAAFTEWADEEDERAFAHLQR